MKILIYAALVIWCRVFQFIFNLAARLLPWRKAVAIEGPGAVTRIPELLGKMKVKKVLLVNGPRLVKEGIAGRIIDILQKAGIRYAAFSDVEPNPSVNTVNAIHKLYVAEVCDGFIALGGGSSMDAAKAAAARVVRPNKSVNQLGGLLKVMKKIPPFIAIPTTAGTGTETTIAAIVTDTETRHKYAIMDLNLVPHYAILDPELTVSMPPSISAATGMDALTHATEAFLCWTYNTKESIRFALEAVKLIFANIDTVYTDGKNIAARQAMLLASYKAGFAFTRAGVGNIHAIAHTLGGLYNVSHGLANAVILPKVLQDYGKKVHKKLARLAQAAGLVEEDKAAKNSAATNAEKAKIFISAINAMNKRMNIPESFDCIKSEDIDSMIKWADRESNPLYPVPVIYSKQRFCKIIKSLQQSTTMERTCET